MPELELEPGEIGEVVDPETAEMGVTYYVRGQGGDFRIAKRRRFLQNGEGFTFPDTTGVPVTPHEERWNDRDGIYVKNQSKTETLTIEWQKKGLEFGFISLGQQKSAASQSNRLFERDENLDLTNGDVIEVDMSEASRHDLEVAFNVPTAVNVDLEVSNSGDFNGEEWVAENIAAGEYTGGNDVFRGYNVNTFRFVRLNFEGSGNPDETGTAEISGAR